MQTPRLPPVDEGEAIRRCLRRHSQNITRTTGLLLLTGFAIGALAVVAPRMGMGAVSVVWLIAGVVHRIITKRRRDRIEALLGPLRAELSEAKLVERGRGDTRRYAVDLVDREGTALRVVAPDGEAARAIVAMKWQEPRGQDPKGSSSS